MKIKQSVHVGICFILLLSTAILGFLVFIDIWKWGSLDYCVGAQQQMIEMAAAAAEERDAEKCLTLLKVYSKEISKKRYVPGFVHASFVRFDQELRALEVSKTETQQTDAANRHPFGTSGMAPAEPASRAGAMPEASGDS